MKNILQKQLRKYGLTCLVAVGSVSNAQSAVIIYFEQLGHDVRISAVGTLAIDDRLSVDSTTSSTAFNGITNTALVNLGSAYYRNDLGAASASGLTLPIMRVPSGSPFGYSGASLFWDAADISGGAVRGVSQLTWSADKDFFIRSGTTLAMINAEALTGQVVWSATTTGDTISVQTIAIVPEPNGIMLSAFGGLILMMRRCRG